MPWRLRSSRTSHDAAHSLEHCRYATRAIDTVEIPDNLQGLLLARIDRMPEDVKHILRVASVIGRQFSVRVLERVLETTGT